MVVRLFAMQTLCQLHCPTLGQTDEQRIGVTQSGRGRKGIVDLILESIKDSLEIKKRHADRSQ